MPADTKPAQLDRYFLDLQFVKKIHTSDGAEFASFFESMMQEVFSNFEKVRPYGNRGDGGNDGFRRNEGIYYQVYAPRNPLLKDTDAVIKFAKDFAKIQAAWAQIETIAEYVFVLNDKDFGTSIVLEEKRKELELTFPNVTFTLLYTKGLRNIFSGLSAGSLLDLGFQIDALNANELANSMLLTVS